MPVNVAIAGAGGRMGQALIEATLGAVPDFALVAALDVAGSPALGRDAGERFGRTTGIVVGSDIDAAVKAADVLIDFTRPAGTLGHAAACARQRKALVAGTIANTNGLLVILAKLVAKGVFDRSDLQSFSDSYSKPLDHVGMRENELVTQMQDQMESTLAELMRYLSERESDA